MGRQGELFGATPLGGGISGEALPLQEHQLIAWQQRLLDYQSPRFEAVANGSQLAPQHLQFWRWPERQPDGAALYFVLDRPPHMEGALLLYVGETKQADRRWKGEHDCKGYLAAYGEALQQANLQSQLSIRFWHDAPSERRARQALEQALIRHWLPPFNKETRGRWATPFTAEPG